MAVTRLRSTVVGMVGLPDVLEWRHEPHALGHARRPLRLRQFIEPLTRNRIFRRIVAVFRNTFELEARTIQVGRGAHAAVPAGVMPRDPDGDVLQWVIHITAL